jgi:hypothetical protein
LNSWDLQKDNMPELIDNKDLFKEVGPVKFKKLLEKFQELCVRDYKGIGTFNLAKRKIKTAVENPIYIPPYRKSQKEREEIKSEITKLLDAKIIHHSKSPWSAPVVMIPKPDGSRRFCVDCRQLNKVTLLDPHPIPRIDDILDRLQGSKWFSTLDLKCGYWQVAMEPDSIAKTAFTTPDGHYEWLKLPFGFQKRPFRLCP